MRRHAADSIEKKARLIWGELSETAVLNLKELVRKYGLSALSGDLQLLNGRWYVTHSGLLHIAKRFRCSGITTSVDQFASDRSSGRWVFKAIVYTAGRRKRFVGYGDADASNVSPLVRGAEMRVAETRAVNRALRKAYGIGLCSVEELGSSIYDNGGGDGTKAHRFAPSNAHGSTNGQPKLRDRLRLLIRKYDLDAARVKRYAGDFCGTEVLRDAGRDLVESFIATLENQAINDHAGLICKLNSYSVDQEVRA